MQRTALWLPPAAVLLAACTLWLGTGCSGSSTNVDGGDQPLPLDEPLGPGQVRAGRITREAELIGGPEAHGWIGDYKLYNDRVAFIVQGLDDVRSWSMTGGTLLDADRVRPAGEPGRDVFQEMFLNLDLQTMQPTAIAVTADGSDGQAAVVRLEGVPHGFIIVDGMFPGMLSPQPLSIVQEYILEPDADYLRVRTTLRSTRAAAVSLTAGDLVLNGDLAEDFIEGKGLVTGQGFSGELAYYAGVSEYNCSLYTGARGPVSTGLSLEGITPLEVAEGDAPPARSDAEPLTVERLLIVGDGGLDSCLRILGRLRGEARTGTVSGHLTAGGQPLAGAMVLARDASRPETADVVDQTWSAADGSFALELAPGSYRLAVRAPGRVEWLSDPIELAAEQQATRDAELPAAAELVYDCRALDETGAEAGPLPCKITFQDGLGAAPSAPGRDDLLAFGPTGSGRLAVPPGEYTVTLSHGWEYAISRQDLAIQAGQEVSLEAVLAHQVDTRGYIAADLHNHSGRSPETHFPIEDKLAANICEGVELQVATDHDCTSDFQGQLEALSARTGADMGAWIRTVPGVEVSPFGNHFTTFPLPVHPSGWQYWQIPYVDYGADGLVEALPEFPELFARARALGAAIINVAHPIGDKGYFSQLGFDPPGTIPRLADLPADKYSPAFDTIEVDNSGDTGDTLTKLVPLWSALNNQGLFRTATGVSDAHLRTDTPGHARTLIASSTDRPAEIDLNEIWANLKAGRALVGDGILVTISIAGHGPGELVEATPPLAVHLRVEAADWVPADRLTLLANGQAAAELDLPPPGQLDPARPALRFDDDVAIEPQADTWYAALATGPEDPGMRPVVSGRAVGMTNAIRVDVDGNGRFDPPE